MSSTIEVVLSEDDQWHRLDILGCDYASVLSAPKDRRRISRDDVAALPHERCEKCTW